MTALILYLIWAHCLGLSILALINPGQKELSAGLRHSLAGPIGMVIFLWIGLIHHLFHAETSLIILAAVTAVLLALAMVKRGGHSLFGLGSRPHQPFHWYDWGLLLTIGFQVIYIFFSAVWRPVAMDDDWSHWACNSKMLYHQGALSIDFLRFGRQAYYPQFIVMNEVIFSKLLGRWDDFLGKAILTPLFFYFAAFCGAWTYRQYRSRTVALLAVFLVVTAPTFVRVGLDGTAELPITFFLAFTAGTLVLAETAKSRWVFFIPGILAGGAASVKSEGLFAVVAIIGVWGLHSLFHRRPLVKPCLALILPVLLLALPWRWAVAALLEGHPDVEGSRIATMSALWLLNPQSLLDILNAALSVCLAFRYLMVVGIYFLIACLYFLVRERKDHASRLFIIMMLAVALVYTAGCYSTGWPGQLPRLFTHLTGIGLLFIFRQVALVLGSSQKAKPQHIDHRDSPVVS